jgi:4'-phosphopantetheinyl transferase
VVIGAGTVDLWVVPLTVPSTPEDSDLLDDAERARAAQRAFAHDRDRFVAAHAALRRILAQYLGAAPAALRFSTDANGKPHVVGMRSAALGWNLSHSADLALVAVAADQVGVDIECPRPLVDLPALAQRCLTESESGELAACQEEARIGAFLSGWTRKEACMKAVGAGLALDPRILEVGLGSDERVVQFSWDGREHRLIVCSVAGASNALAAIALPVHGGASPIVVRRRGLVPPA